MSSRVQTPPPMAPAAPMQTLEDILNLTDREGDSMIGNVEELLVEARRNMWQISERNQQQFSAQANAVTRIVLGFESWYTSSMQGTINDPSRSLARRRLVQMHNNIQNLSNINPAANITEARENEINQSIARVDGILVELINMFPLARPTRLSNVDVNSDTSVPDASASEYPRETTPEDRPEGLRSSANSYTTSSTHMQPRSSTTDSNLSTESNTESVPRSIRLGRVLSEGNARTQVGHRFLNGADVSANISSIVAKKLHAKDQAYMHLGNTYGGA